jgi:hypothetical protein
MPYWLDENIRESSNEERTPQDVSEQFFEDIKSHLNGVQEVTDIKHDGYKSLVGKFKNSFFQLCILESFLHIYVLKPEGDICVHATNEYEELPELFTFELFDYEKEEPIKVLLSNYNIEDYRDIINISYSMFLTSAVERKEIQDA